MIISTSLFHLLFDKYQITLRKTCKRRIRIRIQELKQFFLNCFLLRLSSYCQIWFDFRCISNKSMNRTLLTNVTWAIIELLPLEYAISITFWTFGFYFCFCFIGCSFFNFSFRTMITIRLIWLSIITKEVLVAINKNKYERSSKSNNHGRGRTGFS